MLSKVGGGVIAGLIAGIVFGMMMQMMSAPTPQGGHMPMMQMVAMVVRSDSIAVGWLYHLFNRAVIGAIFGLVLGGRTSSNGAGLGWGALYVFCWWILGAWVLMPERLVMPPFASILRPTLRVVTLGD